jgi:hypothetical protein
MSEGTMKINKTKNKAAKKLSVYDRTVSFANVNFFVTNKKGKTSYA